jgi:PHD/YefM family antitoxin component YafN of YafNO toxin-antitoxin module
MCVKSVSQVRSEFSEILNRLLYQGERVTIERHGKKIAAMITVEDLELLQLLEDHLDLEAIRKARIESGTTPWEDIKVELGL